MTDTPAMASQRTAPVMTREDLIAESFVQLADSLVDDFDIIDLLTALTDRCVELLDTDAAAILLADSEGKLRVIAASNEQARLVELFQIQNDEGPCLEAHSTGRPVVSTDLGSAQDLWPRFTAEALNAGFQSVYALPLRLRADALGALNLFRASPGPMPDADVRLAQALADSATIAIMQDLTTRESTVKAGQLQHALDSRVTIEQAKGMLAERSHIDMSEAFHQLRTYAQDNNCQLTAVALDIIDGTLPLNAITSRPRKHR